MERGDRHQPVGGLLSFTPRSAAHAGETEGPHHRDLRFVLYSGQATHRAPNLAAKAGLHGLAKAIAREFGPDGITANTVAPGAIDTVRDWTQYVHQPREQIAAEIPLKRFGHVDELAGACLFLASDAGGFVSGQAIHVNGGYYTY